MSPEHEKYYYMGSLPTDTPFIGKVSSPSFMQNVRLDPTMPKDEIRFVNKDGDTVMRFTNVGTPKSDIIHSLEDNMSVKAAPDPSSIMTPEQVKEYANNPYYRDYVQRKSEQRIERMKLRDSGICAHERKRYVTRWRCLDCGIYL